MLIYQPLFWQRPATCFCESGEVTDDDVLCDCTSFLEINTMLIIRTQFFLSANRLPLGRPISRRRPVEDICCDLPVTEPASFHWHITVSATDAFLLPDPECGMLYLKNSDRTQASDSLGTNWNRTCLSRLLNHGALWQIAFLRLINILTYLLIKGIIRVYLIKRIRIQIHSESKSGFSK